MNKAEILKQYFGFDNFRPLQEEIIDAVLENKDTLALLPTGGGKSICFQVPALLKEGICIVVSPLIALMRDQVDNLTAKGVNAVAIFSGMRKREIDILLDNCIYGNIKFLYLSPERLLSDIVRTRISYMNVNLIAVDEAHCISQWGYDFRPPYLKLHELREILPKVPIIALTATATEFVRKDIISKLELREPQLFVKSFGRKNLSYVVFDLEDKYKKLIEIARSVNGSGLVYVRNRRETADTASFLKRNDISADFYHAGLETDERNRKQEEWKKGKIRIMVATNAFGMGIDKADVRFVVHLDLPESLEAYYQEAGRAGRDEIRAYAVLLTNDADQLILTERYNESFPGIEEIKKIYHSLGNYFQLAYGAGEGLSFEFSIADFCKRYNIGAIKAISGLKFLEHDGYITLSENIFLPSRIMFTVGNEDLYRFQIENAAYDPLIKTLLRSYGGLFDQYTKINESDIAQRLGISFNSVVNGLKKIEEQEIVSYLPQTDQPQIQFVRSRVDLLHLDIDINYINLRKKIQEDQIKAVLAYAKTSRCRSMQLLAYFDEPKSDKCGVCDVCLQEKRNEELDQLTDKIDFEIITLLQTQAYSIEDLLKLVRAGSEQDRINRIRLLLDAGKIRTDSKNYYL